MARKFMDRAPIRTLREMALLAREAILHPKETTIYDRDSMKVLRRERPSRV